MNFNKLFIAIITVLINISFSFGQKCIESVSNVTPPNNLDSFFKIVGSIGDKTIGRYQNTMRNENAQAVIYQNGEMITKSFLKVIVDGKEFECEDFFFTNNELVGFFHLIGTKKGATNCMYIQKFDLNLKPIGDKKMILDLKSIDYQLVSTSQVVRLKFSSISSFNNNYHLLGMTVQPREYSSDDASKGDNVAYAVVLDSALNMVNEYFYKATYPQCDLKIDLLKLFDNGKALLSVAEISDTGFGNSESPKSRLKSFDIVIGHTKGSILKADPMLTKYTIRSGLKASSNINDGDKFIYGISSSGMGNFVCLTLREIDLKKSLIDSKVPIDIPMDPRYKIDRIIELENNSKIVVFSNIRSLTEWGLVVCKIDQDGELIWKKNIYRASLSDFFFDSNNNLTLLITYDEKLFEGGELPQTELAWANENSNFLPVLVSISNESESFNMKKLEVPGIAKIDASKIKKTNKNGIFWLGDASSLKLTMRLFDLNAH